MRKDDLLVVIRRADEENDYCVYVRTFEEKKDSRGRSTVSAYDLPIIRPMSCNAMLGHLTKFLVYVLYNEDGVDLIKKRYDDEQAHRAMKQP